MEDVPQMVAAAHQACETLTGLAHAEHDQIRAAAQAGRILVPTRSLPAEYDIPYPFARAPQERVEVLLTRYGEAGRASRQAADAVGEVAELVQAPSQALTLARSAVAGRPDRVPEVSDAAPGHSLKRTTVLGHTVCPARLRPLCSISASPTSACSPEVPRSTVMPSV